MPLWQEAKKLNPIFNSMHRRTAYFYLLLVSIIWGAAGPVVKHTLAWFDPLVFLTYRFALSSIVAFTYFRFINIKIPKKTGDLGLVTLFGFLSSILAIGLFFYAMTKTSALTASILTTLGPLLLIAAGAVFFHDRITRYERFGITLAMTGAIITAFGPLLGNGREGSAGAFQGNLLMILATIADIFAAVLVKVALRRRIDAAFLAQSQFIFGFVVLLPIILIKYPLVKILNMIYIAPLPAHLGVLFMAFISGTFAYTIRNKAIRTIEVSEVAVFNYLQPVWAAVLCVFWLKESITNSYAIGACIITLGVIIAEHKRRKYTHINKRRQKKHKVV